MIPVNILNNYLNHLHQLCGRPEESLVLAELNRCGLSPYIPSFPLPNDQINSTEGANQTDCAENNGGYFYVVDGVLYIEKDTPIVIAHEVCVDSTHSEVY